MTRWLETDSLSNQNISSAAAIGAYTADADRLILCDVSVDAVAGGGDYVMYITRQIGGAGSAYVILPKTTMTAAAGETAISGQSGHITVRSGDVLTVYVDGLAGDTTTPDTAVRWFEMAALRPTTADRTLDIEATGEASANVTYSAGEELASRLATKAEIDAALTLLATAAALGVVDTQVDAIKAKTDLISAATLTVSSPVAADGDVELYAGDDYNNADARSLEWSSSDWPDLTGATITLYLRAPDGSKFSKAGSAPVVGSGSQTVRVELTAAETATLIDWPTPSTLRLRATLAVSGRKVTLVTGVLTVAEDIS